MQKLTPPKFHLPSLPIGFASAVTRLTSPLALCSGRLLRRPRCSRLCRLAPRYAGAAIDADRQLAAHGRAADHPFLVAVVIDGVMLGGGIVPHRHVARMPTPTHG